MSEYERGSTANFYANFKKSDGSPATLSGSPKIKISHYTSAGIIVDVGYTNLTLLTGMASNYCYQFSIPARADEGIYTVFYSGTYSDGTNVVGSEDFQVIPRNFYDRVVGGMVSPGKDSIWGKEDKDKLFELIKKILEFETNNEENVIGNKELSDKIFRSAEEGSEKISKLLTETISIREKLIKKSDEIMEKDHRLNEEIISEQQKLLDEQRKLDINLLGVLSKINYLEHKTKEDLSKDRSLLTVSMIEDLSQDLESLKSAFVRSLSTEELERITDEKNG